MSDRTKVQAEANEIDMEMHRLAGRIERFASERPSDANRSALMQISDSIFGSRWQLRRHMHPADQEATK